MSESEKQTVEIPISVDEKTVDEHSRIRREYQLLFDKVPCNIILIDRDYNVVRANERARATVGNLVGKPCYKGLKKADSLCTECTARQTFADGKMHTGHHLWKSQSGQVFHLHVITVPMSLDNGSFDTVMELAVDVTQTVELEADLKFVKEYLETLIATSMDGVLALNEKGKVTVFNPAARRMFGAGPHHVLSLEEMNALLPKGFLAQVSESAGNVVLPESEIRRLDGSRIPVRLVGSNLIVDEEAKGMALSIEDLRQLKELEKQKLEAERLAAVGQTVAGLAHGVKNLVNALEGGMYMLNSGLKNGEIERIGKGMSTLRRNIDRIGATVKAFLNFSKGMNLSPERINPIVIVGEVIEVFAAKAEALGIEFEYELVEDMAPANLDYAGVYECVSNLVDNAIYACVNNDAKKKGRVRMRAFDEEGAIVVEVEDNGCGMDYEVKRKVFSSFFTTKGLDGTGLGLLMTKKIIQEHGGMVQLSSVPGKGSTFQIRLPRNRLPRISASTP